MFGICLPNYYICNRNEKKIKQENINLTIFKEMNKKLFFLAIAALGLAACSNDDVVEINQGEAISFRPLTTNVTRASDVNAGTLQESGFTVFAKQGESTYFNETAFIYGTGTYNSATKYYWPSSGNLDFFAYAYSKPEDHASQVSHTALTYAFTVTPDASAQYQTDLVIACTTDKSKTGTYDAGAKTYGSDGVPLNFRHAESKVTIKLQNTSSALKFTVGNVIIGNINTVGTYTFTGSTNNANEATTNTNTDATSGYWLKFGDWTSTTSGSYTQAANTTTYNGVTAAAPLTHDMILIPQQLTNASTYATGDNNAAFNGSYITVQIKIQNSASSAYILGSAEAFVTALWPLPATKWLPGYHYTYTVDLSGGGYNPTNVDGTDSGLDPVLDGAEIKFVSVTVDAWNETPGNTDVTM